MRAMQLPSEEATRGLGRQLGALAQRGDVLALVGPLGAGKTCLAQGLAQGLAVPPDCYVNSPTFNIIQIHEGGRLPLFHVDLYRIGDPDEALGLGLEAFLGSEGVAVVEWANRLPEVLPSDTLWVRLDVTGPEARSALFHPRGPRAGRLLESL